MKKQGPAVSVCPEIIPRKIQARVQKQLRWWCAAVAIAFAASGAAPRAGASGQLAVQPASINFGNVSVGRTSTITVTLSNTGSSTVTLSGDTLTGTGFKLSGITLPKYI